MKCKHDGKEASSIFIPFVVKQNVDKRVFQQFGTLTLHLHYVHKSL